MSTNADLRAQQGADWRDASGRPKDSKSRVWKTRRPETGPVTLSSLPRERRPVHHDMKRGSASITTCDVSARGLRAVVGFLYRPSPCGGFLLVSLLSANLSSLWIILAARNCWTSCLQKSFNCQKRYNTINRLVNTVNSFRQHKLDM